MASTADPTRCPICGQPNRCAMEVERESGLKQGPCWCLGADFSADLLAQVPAEAQARACICAACAGHDDQDAARASSLALRKPPVP